MVLASPYGETLGGWRGEFAMTARATLRTVPAVQPGPEHVDEIPERRRLDHAAIGSAQAAAQAREDALSAQAIQTTLVAARACMTLGETEIAVRLLDECDRLSRRRPQSGQLMHQLAVLRGQLHHLTAAARVAHFPLTPAEGRLLPVLATHLTFAEIAGELFLSRHTVKTQAISIYRKLGVSSRSQAVARAHELALIDD